MWRGVYFKFDILYKLILCSFIICFKIYKREWRIIDLEVCIILNSLVVYGFFGYMCILRCGSKEKFLDNVIIYLL